MFGESLHAFPTHLSPEMVGKLQFLPDTIVADDNGAPLTRLRLQRTVSSERQ